MFDLANDRLSYSELLRPDAGYFLNFSVGMTYSLDLEALLGVPVSLGMLDDADEGNLRSPLYILEAIRKSANKIAIFCNAGGIKLPDKIQSVYSLLENSVFQVKLTKTSNFHPKIWVLKYSQSGKPSYIKLLVLSRNLTFDSSIDISVALQGKIGKKDSEKNRPLADFLSYVSNFADRKKKQQILSLAKDVLKVAAFEVDPPFEDYDIFPIGIPGYSENSSLLFGQKSDLFVVSPFLSDETVQKMTQFKGNKRLVTRKSSVTPTVMESFDHVYVTKDVLNDNEYGAQQDIHAKIYYTTTLIGNYLYLGSANASQNAFGKNIECLLRLRYKPYSVGFLRFADDFVPKVYCPYEELTYVPEQQAEDSRKQEIDKALKEAVYALKHAVVVPDGNNYSVTVDSRPMKTTERIMIAPLQRPDLVQPLDQHLQFSRMLLKELSEFYVLSIESQKLITKVLTRDMPKDRDQAIYRSIIDSKPKFMSYLSFVLSGDLSGGADDTADLAEAMLHAGGNGLTGHSTAALYEQMLRVFHQNPAKLKGISDMIRRLGQNVVGDDFVPKGNCQCEELTDVPDQQAEDSQKKEFDKALNDFREMYGFFEAAAKKVRR